jgi:hypothetical protein
MPSEFWPNAEFSLGLSMPVNSHKVVPPSPESRERKGKVQTSYSKRMVRNAAWWLEREVTKENLSFLTATLPDEAVDTLEAREDAAALWAECTRQYNQWIKRQLDKAELCNEIVGCDEVQPSRWRKDGRVALHLHVIFQGRKDRRSPWAISKEACLKKWLDIISNVLGVPITSTSATRIERVKKSAQNYLAKYMSKSGSIIDEIVAAGKRYMLPTQWWHCSANLKTLIKSMCVPISQEAKNVLYDMREELKNQKIIQWFHVAEIELFQPHGEAIRIPVAYCGKLSKSEYISMFDY